MAYVPGMRSMTRSGSAVGVTDDRASWVVFHATMGGMSFRPAAVMVCPADHTGKKVPAMVGTSQRAATAGAVRLIVAPDVCALTTPLTERITEMVWGDVPVDVAASNSKMSHQRRMLAVVGAVPKRPRTTARLALAGATKLWPMNVHVLAATVWDGPTLVDRNTLDELYQSIAISRSANPSTLWNQPDARYVLPTVMLPTAVMAPNTVRSNGYWDTSVVHVGPVDVATLNVVAALVALAFSVLPAVSAFDPRTVRSPALATRLGLYGIPVKLTIWVNRLIVSWIPITS